MAEDDRTREEALIRRFRTGDEEAFRVLLERHQRTLEARIQRCLPAHLDRKVAVSDVLQESCVVAFQRRADLEPRGANAFRNWLLGIVEKRAREAVRYHGRAAKRAARREVTRAQRPETAQFPSRQPSPSQVAIGAELRQLARQAMESLPPDYRTVLRLAREERLNLREVAEHMGRSHAATRKLYGRAACRFREAFDALRGKTDA